MLVLRILLFRLLALGSLLLGLIGVVVPGLPTVPFILLAAFAAGKGWPALEARLLAHHRYGPLIHNWRAFGVVPRSGKIAASLMMLISLLLGWTSGLTMALKLTLTLLLMAVALWLWLRPEQAVQKDKI
jgi:uncharacterized protein